MNFKKWVKSIQTAGYNGARTVYHSSKLAKAGPGPDHLPIQQILVVLGSCQKVVQLEQPLKTGFLVLYKYRIFAMKLESVGSLGNIQE
jgi:hypothetical protein